MIYSDREPALRRRTSRRIGEEERSIPMNQEREEECGIVMKKNARKEDE